ncbi:MAG: DUF4157 domain-containing protein [Marinomonas sp.]
MCDLWASKFHRLFKKEAEWPTHYPARSIGVRLPTDLKLGMEKLTGLNLNQVRVHYASPLPALVHAHGYAQGSQIYLALGQEHHLPHELGHVVQQMWGMVEATTEVNGVAVNDDPKLEEHATKLGQLALNAGVNHGRHSQRNRHVSSLKTLP